MDLWAADHPAAHRLQPPGAGPDPGVPPAVTDDGTAGRAGQPNETVGGSVLAAGAS